MNEPKTNPKINPNYFNSESETLTASESSSHKIPNKTPSNIFDHDEEQEYLLDISLTSHSSHSDKKTHKFWVNFFMFFNICRSFIAIGVLAIPYGLSKIGTVSF
jgi:hypothetical protein